MPDETAPWSLEDFGARLDAWIETQSPDVDLSYVVTEWVFTRLDDPYQGVSRAKDLPNLWYGTVPGTNRDGRWVVCAYWIFERTRTLRCDNFATLGRPLA